MAKRKRTNASITFKGKSENDDASAKLYLRRYFLDKYHGAEVMDRPSRVLDCCQAEGVLWDSLRSEYPVQYWGVDRELKAGRLAIDSVRLLASPRLPYDVIDIDTYGSPWRHWEALLPNVIRPTTIFLTQGKTGGATAIDNAVLRALGVQFSRAVPKTLQWRLGQIGVAPILSRAYTYGVDVIEAREAMPRARNARYFGIRIAPSRLSNAPG